MNKTGLFKIISTLCFSLVIFLCGRFSWLEAQILQNDQNFLAPPVGQSIALQDGFTKIMTIGNEEYKVTLSGWNLAGNNGVTRENDTFRLEATPARESVQVRQVITFDPPLKLPIQLSAKCRSRTTKVNDQCSLFLDVFYDDGTPLWGMATSFPAGDYDFRSGTHSFFPEKPIRSIQTFLLFRKSEGTVWFDEIFVGPHPLSPLRIQTIGGLFGQGSVAAFAKPGMFEHDLKGSISLQEADGTQISSHTETPALLIHPADETIRPRFVAAHFSRPGGETATAMELVDTNPCDGGRGYCVWTTTSMERIFPYSLPRVKSDDATEIPSGDNLAEEKTELRRRLGSPTVSLELARNEYESFQIGMLSPVDLKDVTVECSDLVLKDHPDVRIDRKHLDWKQVGFVRADRITPHPKETEGLPGWWPDPLLPVERFDVPAGQTQPVWITVFAPKETEPGVYHGTISLIPQNAPKTDIPLVVTVWNIELADEGHLKNAFALMDGYLEQVYNMRPTTPELRKRYGDFMLKHRLTPEGDISRTRLPVLEELEYYRGRGLGAFNILNMVEDRGRRTWVCNSLPEIYTPEFKEAMFAKLKPYIEELRKRGLSEQAYIYTFDERGEDYAEIMTDFFGMVKEHFPEVSTLTTSYITQDILGMKSLHTDWMCPLTPAYHFDEAEKCREAGMQVWSYICCGPRYPYANIMCRFPLIESRVFPWQAYHQKMDGLLYWGVNIWHRANNTPIDASRGPFLEWSVESFESIPIYGDGILIYAGTDGQPIGSIRLANLRDGFEDYEYLDQLGEKKGSMKIGREYCLPVTTSLTDFTRNPETLYRQRCEIARELAKMNE